MMSSSDRFIVDYRPRMPADRRKGVAIVGCGQVARDWHLPAYRKHGFEVVGVYDVDARAARLASERFEVPCVYPSLNALLSDRTVHVVDIATRPDVRVGLMRQAIAAGKHVLAQKPLAPSVAEAAAVVEEAERRGLRIAVNHNGRWSPPWRIATLLIERGAIGDVIAVTHLHDASFARVQGTHFDEIPQFAIYDYSIHWFDITRCWLGEAAVECVRARSFRTPHQPAAARTPWGMWAEIAYDSGASAVVRGVGHSRTRTPGHPFWVHGTEATIRGNVLGDDFLELETSGRKQRYLLEGSWYPDGFAATLGELMAAVEEDREPFNSARHNLLSLAMTLAAVESAERDGAAIPIGGR